MSIELKATKIDPTGMGVSPLPDTPALSEEEMQKKFDELPLAAIEQLNAVIEDLLTLKAAITNAVGVVIPETTSLLRGDGEGGAAAATMDSEPTEGSSNPISSGAVYEAVNGIQTAPTVNEETIAESKSVSLEDNSIYVYELGAYDLTLLTAAVTGDVGAHIFLYVTSANATVTISDATLTYGDSLENIAAGQYWEISVFKQRVIVKNVTA